MGEIPSGNEHSSTAAISESEHEILWQFEARHGMGLRKLDPDELKPSVEKTLQSLCGRGLLAFSGERYWFTDEGWQVYRDAEAKRIAFLAAENRKFLAGLDGDLERLKADPAAWAEYQRELKAWGA